MKLDRAIDLAIAIAEESDMRYKLGAILYDDKQYVMGWNRGLGCECETRDNSFSIHAEEMCVMKGNRCGIDFDKSTLVVVRINKAGDVRCSKPCRNCRRLIKKVGIRKVWHVENDNDE